MRRSGQICKNEASRPQVKEIEARADAVLVTALEGWIKLVRFLTVAVLMDWLRAACRMVIRSRFQDLTKRSHFTVSQCFVGTYTRKIDLPQLISARLVLFTFQDADRIGSPDAVLLSAG